MIVLAPISVGELIDKITILEIKLKNITDPVKLENISIELMQLNRIQKESLEMNHELMKLKEKLYIVNQELWFIENLKRSCEAKLSFDKDFIAAARNVYLKNDTRAMIKRKINILTGSDIIEEKSYNTVI